TPPDPEADRDAADAWVTAQAQQRRAARWLSGLRQVVETAFQTLTGVLGLTFPRARSFRGLLARTGAKVAAHNLALLVNHLVGRPVDRLAERAVSGLERRDDGVGAGGAREAELVEVATERFETDPGAAQRLGLREQEARLVAVGAEAGQRAGLGREIAAAGAG